MSTTSSVLMHQLVPSKQPLSFPWLHKYSELPRENSKNCPFDKMFDDDRDGKEFSSPWNFIKSATNPFRRPAEEPEKVYVHPLSKRSTSCLSTRSLEMCTESLGTETGSCIDPGINELSFHVSERQSYSKTRELIKKVVIRSSFPPPLTSISGSEGVQVQTHRQGGRLVIKAFSFSSSSTYFQAERENGRLRLSLLKDGDREGQDDSDANDEEFEQENDDEPGKDWGENEDEEAGFSGCFWGGNGDRVVCKMGGGEWCNSRCNGDRNSRKRIPCLPFCVAIS